MKNAEVMELMIETIKDLKEINDRLKTNDFMPNLMVVRENAKTMVEIAKILND